VKQKKTYTTEIKANYLYVRENEGTLVNGQFRDNNNKKPK
jgi:regulator of RNase E activity RraA